MSKTRLGYLALAAVILVLDQLTKQMIVSQFALYESLPVTSFFNLVHVHNYGAAFSFLSDQGGWQRWFFTGIASVISLAIVIWLWRLKPQQRLLAAALALILGGALGNLYDRLVLGYVVDFLDFYLGKWHWPAFNLADSAIFVGAALLLLDSFLNGDGKQKD